MFNWLDNLLAFNYKNLADEEKINQAILEYQYSFLEKVCNLYNIKCKDIITKSYNILKYAFLNGHCGIAKIDGKYYVGMGSYVGNELDKDGIPTEYTITFLDGTQYTGKIGKDIVVLWYNNIARSNKSYLGRLSYMLADVDASLNYNIKFSRVCPIPIVSTDIEMKSMEKIMDNLFNGVMKIFKKTNVKDFLSTSATRDKDTLDLTNPSTSVYIQHLSRFHDELLIRACLELGVFVSSRDKGAQLTDKELSAFADYCVISSDDTYNMLLEWAEECKRVFDIDIEVTPKAFVYTEKEVAENEDTKGGANNE